MCKIRWTKIFETFPIFQEFSEVFTGFSLFFLSTIHFRASNGVELVFSRFSVLEIQLLEHKDFYPVFRNFPDFSRIFTGSSLFFLSTIKFSVSNGVNLGFLRFSVLEIQLLEHKKSCVIQFFRIFLTFHEFSQDFLQFSQKLPIVPRPIKQTWDVYDVSFARYFILSIIFTKQHTVRRRTENIFQ